MNVLEKGEFETKFWGKLYEEGMPFEDMATGKLSKDLDNKATSIQLRFKTPQGRKLLKEDYSLKNN